jgi:hypothetical protein
MADERKEQVDLSARVRRYANAFNIGFNAFEVVLEFGQQLSEDEDAAMHTRIITHPIYAKALYESLGESLLRYGREFGWSDEAALSKSESDTADDHP